MGRGSCGAGRSLSTAPPLPGSVLAPGNPYLGNQVRTCPVGKQRRRKSPGPVRWGRAGVTRPRTARRVPPNPGDLNHPGLGVVDRGGTVHGPRQHSDFDIRPGHRATSSVSYRDHVVPLSTLGVRSGPQQSRAAPTFGSLCLYESLVNEPARDAGRKRAQDGTGGTEGLAQAPSGRMSFPSNAAQGLVTGSDGPAGVSPLRCRALRL
jgi:hypothetical protein